MHKNKFTFVKIISNKFYARKYNPILMDLLKLFPIKRYWVDL